MHFFTFTPSIGQCLSDSCPPPSKSAILIPLPTAADDHQTVNASVIEAAGAACHLPQRDATPEKLAGLLKDWLASPEKWAERGQKFKAFGKPNAAASMVKVILGVLDNLH